jgi:uncharacterized protein YceK
MKRIFIMLMSLVFLVGCASITIETTGNNVRILKAQGYTVKISPDGTMAATPRKMFDLGGFLKELFGVVTATVGTVTK